MSFLMGVRVSRLLPLATKDNDKVGNWHLRTTSKKPVIFIDLIQAVNLGVDQKGITGF